MPDVDNDFFENFGRKFEEFKRTNAERLDAIENGDTGKAKEVAGKLKRIEDDLADMGEIKDAWERQRKVNSELKTELEELQAQGNMPGQSAEEKGREEYRDSFWRWMRKGGKDREAEEKMYDLATKDVSIGTPAAGGHAMPEVIGRTIEKLEHALSDIVQEVKTVQIGTNDYKELVDLDGATSGWVGETDTRSATVTPTLRQVAPTMGELYAYVTASEWSLDDIFFNVEEWLTTSAAEQFALQGSTAIWQGTGSNQPTGITLTSPVSTADHASPLRAAAVYQYVLSSASPANLTAASLFDTLYELKRPYLNNAKWASNRATMGFIRQLADTNGQYLWAPGLAAGEPNRLLGYPHFIWEDMPNIADEEEPVAFGDFRRAYLRAVRRETRVTVDNVTAAGFVKFYIRRREGGIPLNNDAVKLVKVRG